MALTTMDHLQINEAFSDLYAQLYTSEHQADYNEIPYFLNDLCLTKSEDEAGGANHGASSSYS